MISKPQNFVLPSNIQEGTRAELDYLVSYYKEMRKLDNDTITNEILANLRYVGYRSAELAIEFGIVEA